MNGAGKVYINAPSVEVFLWELAMTKDLVKIGDPVEVKQVQWAQMKWDPRKKHFPVKSHIVWIPATCCVAEDHRGVIGVAYSGGGKEMLESKNWRKSRENGSVRALPG